MTLAVLWFVIITILWAGYLSLEGFDFGVGMLLKTLGRDEQERRATIMAIGPHWDGNEVWLVTAGATIFAAFPEWYGTLFSGAYIPLLLILLCLIVRVCAIEWRPKINSQSWRDRWDWVHTVAAWVPSVLWGVVFANLVQGMHVEVVETASGAIVPANEVPADSLINGAAHQVTGSFWSMLTPFTLLGGAVTCLLFLSHGASFLRIKTTGELSRRAEAASQRLGVASTAVTVVWALWAQLVYSASTLSWVPLALAALGLTTSLAASRVGRGAQAFALHFAGIAFVVIFIFTAMAPDVMRSSADPAYSLTLTQAASADTTLMIMLAAIVVFMPGVLAYTIWSYKVFSGRISPSQVNPDEGGLHPTLIRDSAQPEAHIGH
ncbi:cytochrome d ubiquinol oxidase subunit II [Actinomyces sp. 2119]|uniref:cytochrome d ubiquinol oxidase subunit II n=1 Tax=Actinomyces sp. 2119 TaxID=2321393 RepID=UPI000E6CFDE4|nr:cytochrome d ubiquinol oxidase subunit II [Actinomyces sp. 2119]RJF42515.1 cytochrome d ubiquinol oxidase subunit II [Actinomyces sp. 2119]